MCRRYVELYSVQKLEKKMKRINFINLFSLLGDENNFLSSRKSEEINFYKFIGRKFKKKRVKSIFINLFEY